MKIGFLGDGLNLLSGSAKPLFGLMASLENQGHQSHMLSSRLPENLEKINLELIKKNQYGHLKLNRTAETILNGLLKRNKNIVSEIELFCDNSDLLVCTDFSLPWLLKRNQFRPEIPLIFVASNNLKLKGGYLVKSGIGSFVNLIKPSFFSKLLIPDFIYSSALSKFDHIIATSHFVKQSFEEMGIISPITVLPVGIKIPSQSQEYLENEESFSFFGWGSGIRGLQDVLSAFELYRSDGGLYKLKLFLQGHHGYEEHVFVRKIKKLKYSRNIEIQFFTTDIEKSILSSNAVILPFRVPFGYSQPPLTILESMALGKVVISTNIGSIPEIITDSENGFLVRPADPKKIANILLTLNDEVTGKIGGNAFYTIKNQYSWDIVSKRYSNLFEQLGGSS